MKWLINRRSRSSYVYSWPLSFIGDVKSFIWLKTIDDPLLIFASLLTGAEVSDLSQQFPPIQLREICFLKLVVWSLDSRDIETQT